MKPGRNDPCSCGSGLKYKKCCALAGTPTPTARSELDGFAHLIRHGRFAELERAATRLIHAQPGSGLGWKLLGVAQWQQGKDALTALRKAAALLPEDPENHSNLGNALRRCGLIEQAVASHRRALALRAGDPEVHNNLGAALSDLGEHEAAIASYEEALRLDPNLALASVNLGHALARSGLPCEAASCFRRALRVNAALPAAHIGLGAALQAQGLHEQAIECYGRALALDATDPEVHNNLGNALLESGQPARAAASYERAIALNPALVGAYSNLGSALMELGQLERAVRVYERALALQPDSAEILNNLSIALRLSHRHNQSEASASKAHRLRPDLAAPLVSLARLKADAGRFVEAEELLRRALTVDPDSAEACSSIPKLRRMSPDDAPWLAEAQRLSAQRLPARQRSHLHFAMGKYFDDVQDYASAFDHYERANELRKQCSIRYDPGQQRGLIDRIITRRSSPQPGALSADSAGATQPVFVVGMPRSGTSLVEQILASHPEIYGAGEITYWSEALPAWLSEPTSPDGRSTLEQLAHDYLALLEQRSRSARFTVDKMPANFLCLGLIHEALPNARVIHVRRDPIDTCLSIYFQDFESSYPYANDLRDLAHYYTEYQRLMDHWRAVLPADTLLEVSYEAVVSDLEASARIMLNHAGAEWNPTCLQFDHTDRTVITASNWQVRQRLSGASVRRWRNYRDYITPLLQLSEPEGH